MFNFLVKIRISRRLLLISLAYFLPISALVFHVIDGIMANVNFAVWETKGNQYQRPLESLLQSAGTLRYRPEDSVKLTTDIDRQFNALQNVQDTLGGDLQFTDEGLGKRKRSQLKLETVKANWNKVKSTVGTPSFDEGIAGFIADIRGMIAHSGDTSNLILDPDLDSYYLMDVTLLALPQTQDRLAEVIQFTRQILEKGEISDQEKVKLEVYAAMLKESDVARIDADATTSLTEDPNFYGVSKSYQENFPNKVDDYKKKNLDFIATLQQLATNGIATISRRFLVTIFLLMTRGMLLMHVDKRRSCLRF